VIDVRRKAELDARDLGWLKARYHFAIGPYGRLQHSALGNLIAWNDDEIAPGQGFPPHCHRDVEIVTFVREGRIAHRDGLGNSGSIEAGDLQVMSAGTGITHEEASAADVPARVFQIWLTPRRAGGDPRWGTQRFPKEDRAGRLVTFASGFPEDAGALLIRADAKVVGATLLRGNSLSYALPTSRAAYLVPATGQIEVSGHVLAAGDGCVICNESLIRISAIDQTELVVVETA
jgi:quercetin 2,3-dioxygenase